MIERQLFWSSSTSHTICVSNVNNNNQTYYSDQQSRHVLDIVIFNDDQNEFACLFLYSYIVNENLT